MVTPTLTLWKKIKIWADVSIRPISYVVFLVALGIEIWLFTEASLEIQKLYLLPATILLTGIMATCGWMWSGHINRKLQRKRESMALLLSVRRSYVDDLKASVYEYIDAPADKKPEFPEEDIQKLLGFYETISIAVMNGCADEDIIKESQRLVFLRLYEGVRNFIEDQQKKDASFYCHFVYYAVDWNEGAPRLGAAQYVKHNGDFIP